MEINRRESGDVVIFDINGEIDLYNAPDIKEKIKDEMNNGKVNIIINLDKGQLYRQFRYRLC